MTAFSSLPSSQSSSPAEIQVSQSEMSKLTFEQVNWIILQFVTLYKRTFTLMNNEKSFRSISDTICTARYEMRDTSAHLALDKSCASFVILLVGIVYTHFLEN